MTERSTSPLKEKKAKWGELELASFNPKPGDMIVAGLDYFFECHGEDEEGKFLLRRFIPSVGPVERIIPVLPNSDTLRPSLGALPGYITDVVRLENRPEFDQQRFRK